METLVILKFKQTTKQKQKIKFQMYNEILRSNHIVNIFIHKPLDSSYRLNELNCPYVNMMRKKTGPKKEKRRKNHQKKILIGILISIFYSSLSSSITFRENNDNIIDNDDDDDDYIK
ncbi:hypothetical protein DERP_005817 [Dermatophagoides pteronyssinus]|uniref:Uncharacterized protein n=1 Tax=Dermatophagoides pteronyssinus TaxID=6956 RepID=A0ABQ8JA42_DERPT|nr:hypothetical protein DERP_005817 [Dermatophagoides pteronyssinus]